jgi:hypothetical protein
MGRAGRKLLGLVLYSLFFILAMQTTNDVKEQLQEDIITICYNFNPQIPDELISELCQIVANWDTELVD